MRNHEPQNFQTYYCAIFVDSLVRHGLRHAVISPGSRSTPLAIAFASHPRVQKHIVIDERSAGFIALGISQNSGLPAALVCTSGTAVANYLPAICESRMSGTPMIVLSADRDFDEQDTGANQWIDQNKIFGDMTVFHATARVDLQRPVSIDRLRLLADQTWFRSIEKMGCSHINFPFHKPLEPEFEFTEQLIDLYGVSDAKQVTESVRGANKLELEPKTVDRIRKSRNPIIICGAGQQSNRIKKLVQQFTDMHIPVLFEAGSTPVLSGDPELIFGANTFLRDSGYCTELRPDLIIRFGAEPIGKGILNYLKYHKAVHTIHFTEFTNWSNSSFSNTTIIKCTSDLVCTNLPQQGDIDSNWISTWKKLSTNYQSRLSDIIPATLLRDGDVYNQMVRHLKKDEIVMISNSFSARDIDLFGSPSLSHIRIHSNRGVSGIDGITSTAVGIAKSSRQKVTLITGDLAWMHDLNALITMRNDASIQLRIIVLNNNGGNIFRMLPISGSTFYQTYFETPQHLEVSAIAHAMGLEAYSVCSITELSEVLIKSEESRLVLIECKTDPDASMELRKQMWNQ